MTNIWSGILCNLKVIALVHELFDTPSYIENASFEHSDQHELYLLYILVNFTWGSVTFFAPERFICMLTYIYFFLNFILLHSNDNNKVGFVKFSTPDFVENPP